MASLSPIIEFLLATRKEGVGTGPADVYLCRLGLVQTIVPIFPPNFSMTFNIVPEFGSYCNISFELHYSPITPPNTFNAQLISWGTEISGGMLDDIALNIFGHSSFVIRTEANPQVEVLTNISGINQYHAALEWFVIIDTEQDYREVWKRLEAWNMNRTMVELQTQAVALLEQMQANWPPTPSYAQPRTQCIT